MSAQTFLRQREFEQMRRKTVQRRCPITVRRHQPSLPPDSFVYVLLQCNSHSEYGEIQSIVKTIPLHLCRIQIFRYTGTIDECLRPRKLHLQKSSVVSRNHVGSYRIGDLHRLQTPADWGCTVQLFATMAEFRPHGFDPIVFRSIGNVQYCVFQEWCAPCVCYIINSYLCTLHLAIITFALIVPSRSYSLLSCCKCI